MKTIKKLKEMTFNDFVANQTENIFFKFMDFGRKGIEMAAEELVLNISTFQKEQSANKDNKKLLTEEQQQEIINYAVKELTDSLITQGTKGFERVIVSVSTYVANIRNNS